MGYYFTRSRGGLGQVEPDCEQPVPTAERDALVLAIKDWTSPWQLQHFAEGNPTLEAIYRDITGRLSGLEQRPKLLRCSKEARDRAHAWIGQLRELCMAVKSDGPHCSGYTRVLRPFSFTVHRGPTYQVPASGTPAAGASVQSSAPPGTVVVVSSAPTAPPPAATTPPPAPSASSPPSQLVTTVGGGGGVWTPPAAYAQDFMAGELVPGFPNRYLVYGGLALLAYRMLKGR